MKTIFFEDQGQDFLEWDLNDENEVIDSRPYQRRIWTGFKVDRIAVGAQPLIFNPADPDRGWRVLNYEIEAIKERSDDPQD